LSYKEEMRERHLWRDVARHYYTAYLDALPWKPGTSGRPRFDDLSSDQVDAIVAGLKSVGVTLRNFNPSQVETPA
jgi:hypothetical protein